MNVCGSPFHGCLRLRVDGDYNFQCYERVEKNTGVVDLHYTCSAVYGIEWKEK